MTIKYVGKTSERQGEFFVAKSLPQNALLRGIGTPVSIDELTTYASSTLRTPSSDLEIIWRPGQEAEYPRKVGDKATEDSSANVLESVYADTPFVLGVPSTDKTHQSNSSLPGEPTAIAVAYTGLGTAVNDIVVELTKIVQVRYAPLFGTVEAAPEVTTQTQTSPEAVDNLDAKFGDWSVRLQNAAQTMANMTDAVLGGATLLNTVRDVTRGSSALRRVEYG
jgi:hypothetical protein